VLASPPRSPLLPAGDPALKIFPPSLFFLFPLFFCPPPPSPQPKQRVGGESTRCRADPRAGRNLALYARARGNRTVKNSHRRDRWREEEPTLRPPPSALPPAPERLGASARNVIETRARPQRSRSFLFTGSRVCVPLSRTLFPRGELHFLHSCCLTASFNPLIAPGSPLISVPPPARRASSARNNHHDYRNTILSRRCFSIEAICCSLDARPSRDRTTFSPVVSVLRFALPLLPPLALSFRSVNASASFRLAIRERRDARRRYVALLPII